MSPLNNLSPHLRSRPYVLKVTLIANELCNNLQKGFA